jgi:hypothetical protein
MVAVARAAAPVEAMALEVWEMAVEEAVSWAVAADRKAADC